MSECEVCGNHYSPLIEIKYKGEEHKFDCFECAVHALAPTCRYCEVRVIGHGMEEDGRVYCCEHCLREDSALRASRDLLASNYFVV